MVTLEEFVRRANAELVGGNLIVGVLEDRRIIGHVDDGTYFLNDAGHLILRAIETGDPQPVKPKPPKRKPTDNAGKTHEDLIREIDAIDID